MASRSSEDDALTFCFLFLILQLCWSTVVVVVVVVLVLVLVLVVFVVGVGVGGRWLIIALRPQTSKHITGGWSHHTDTSEPVDGNGAQNMVTVQSEFRTRDLSIFHLPTALTGPTVCCCEWW
jgi:hypothetical protein